MVRAANVIIGGGGYAKRKQRQRVVMAQLSPSSFIGIGLGSSIVISKRYAKLGSIARYYSYSSNNEPSRRCAQRSCNGRKLGIADSSLSTWYARSQRIRQLNAR